MVRRPPQFQQQPQPGPSSQLTDIIREEAFLLENEVNVVDITSLVSQNLSTTGETTPLEKDEMESQRASDTILRPVKEKQTVKSADLRSIQNVMGK